MAIQRDIRQVLIEKFNKNCNFASLCVFTKIEHMRIESSHKMSFETRLAKCKYTAVCCLRQRNMSIKTIRNFNEVNLQVQWKFVIFLWVVNLFSKNFCQNSKSKCCRIMLSLISNRTKSWSEVSNMIVILPLSNNKKCLS